jgi:proteasome accessory factor C
MTSTAARTANRIGRILAMIPYIVERDVATIGDLRDRFGYASDSEVVRDLHLIFLTGLPGYGPGDLIDVDIYEDEVTIDSAEYFSRPMKLTPAEALGLLAAGSTFLASNQAPPALASAMDKLSIAIGANADDAVLFDVEAPEAVTTLREAIDETRLIKIGYIGMATNERSVRVVEGESVFFNLGNWYLAGFCRYAQDDRLFRVDRMDSISVLDQMYEPSVADTAAIVRYEPSPDDHEVVFLVGKRSRWVTEYYPVEYDDLSPESTRVTMSVSDPLVAARLLIRLGPDAEFESGAAVGEALLDLRTRITARYV